MKVTFFTVPKCVANLGKGCRQFSRCPHCWLSLIMLFLITCAFKLISSAAFWPSILKRFSLLIGVPQAWEDILIFTSVILLSQSSAACENTLSFIRIYTQILLFDYLIPACPPLKKKKKNQQPWNQNSKPGPAGPSTWRGSSVKYFWTGRYLMGAWTSLCWLPHTPHSDALGLRPAVTQVLSHCTSKGSPWC